MKIWWKSGLNSEITNTLKYSGFSGILNFLLINNISITIEIYVESWVNVVKLDIQCYHPLLLPLLPPFTEGGLVYRIIGNFFVSLSHACEITAASRSMPSYCLKFLLSIFFVMSPRRLRSQELVHEPEAKILDIGVISGNLVWLHFSKFDVNMTACLK